MSQINPLSKYFRVPGVHIKLPSGGRFTPDNIDGLAINGEIPVFPMTAADELLLKSPDALLNGYSIEKMVESCVPSIKSTRKVPAQDMDVILLAIKLASYGDILDLGTTCPSCGHEMEFGVSIQNSILPYVKGMEDLDNTVRLNDNLLAEVQPYNYEAQTLVNMKAFEEAKILQSLINPETDEFDKIDAFNKSFEKITRVNLDLLAECVIAISTPEGKVENPDHIRDFIKNAHKNDVQALLKKVKEFDDYGLDASLKVKCDECDHEWETAYEFDNSHFFVSGSSEQSQNKSQES